MGFGGCWSGFKGTSSDVGDKSVIDLGGGESGRLMGGSAGREVVSV